MLCKRKRKKFKIQDFTYRDTANVEPEMYDCSSNNWNSNEKLKEKFGNCTGKTFLKPEWWESPLVQEKYQKEKSCDKRHPLRIIIIIIIIIIIMTQGVAVPSYASIRFTRSLVGMFWYKEMF